MKHNEFVIPNIIDDYHRKRNLIFDFSSLRILNVSAILKGLNISVPIFLSKRKRDENCIKPCHLDMFIRELINYRNLLDTLFSGNDSEQIAISIIDAIQKHSAFYSQIWGRNDTRLYPIYKKVKAHKKINQNEISIVLQKALSLKKCLSEFIDSYDNTDVFSFKYDIPIFNRKSNQLEKRNFNSNIINRNNIKENGNLFKNKKVIKDIIIDDIDKILLRYQEGESIKNIAKEYGISPSYLSILIKQYSDLNLISNSGNILKLENKAKKLIDFEKWKKNYEHLKKIIKEKGCHFSQYSSDPEIVKLSKWCSIQRSALKNGELSAERKNLLDEIGFIWEIRNTDIWKNAYCELKEYRERTGEWPNALSDDPQIAKLGRWCTTQRYFLKLGKLKIDRKKMLDNIGFQWMPKNVDIWVHNYNELKDYIKSTGEFPKANSNDPQIAKLGMWCALQRRAYKFGKLNYDQIALINDINIHEDSKTIMWKSIYYKVKQYKNDTGDWPSRHSHEADVAQLGRWCYRQRQFYYSGKLAKYKIDMFEEINFEWKYESDNVWNVMFKAVKEYKLKNGKLPVRTPNDKSLSKMASWCSIQRQYFKSGKLSTEQIKKLEEIGLKLEIKRWDIKLNELKEYRENTGKWPSSVSEDDETAMLGRWFLLQKSKLKSNKLNPEKRVKFLKIFDEKVLSWDEKLEATKRYIAENGDSPSATSTDPSVARLGRWCYYQKFNYQKGKLNLDRKKKFEEFILEKMDRDKTTRSNQEKVWNENYEALVKYIKQYQKFPCTYSEDPSVARLGRWIDRQKVYIKGKRGRILPHRKAKIEELISFISNISNTDSDWIEMYESVKGYYKENGVWPNRKSDNNDIAKMGRWCCTQRNRFKLGKISSERKAKLDELNFPWDLGKFHNWDEMFNALKEFNMKTGEWPSAYSKDEKIAELGRWAVNQRYMIRKGIGYKKNPDRKTKFDEIKFPY